MTDRTEDKAFERLLETMSRTSTYLDSLEPGVALLSIVSAIAPDVVWAFVWTHYQPGKLRLAYVLPGSEKADENVLERILKDKSNKQVTLRRMRTLGVNQESGLTSFCRGLESPIRSERADRLARSILVVRAAGGTIVLEMYLDAEIGKIDVDALLRRAQRIVDMREPSFLDTTQPGALSNDDPFDSEIAEFQLLSIMQHEIKSWLGKTLGEAHLFLYDPFDRLLYHRATDKLRILTGAVRSYAAAPLSADASYLDYIENNIKRMPAVSKELKGDLNSVLQKLKDEKWIHKQASNKAAELRLLLSVLPQEPGTAVAGHTAKTLIPEMSNRGEEELWKLTVYPDKWFSVMLSVEQLFGIARSGNMAAIPLLESGQLVGVLFVTRDVVFSRPLDSINLLEQAAQVSALLTLWRTQQFRHAIMAGAINKPNQSTVSIAVECLPLAFNPLLVAHWHVKKEEPAAVELWGFSGHYTRYHMLERPSVTSGMWRNEQIATVVQEWSRSRFQGVVRRPTDENLPRWALPTKYVKEYEKIVSARLNSAVVAVPAGTNDVLVMYLAQTADVLTKNSVKIAEKLSTLGPIQMLREASERPTPTVIGETDAYQEVLDSALTAAKMPRVYIYGPSGSGKSSLAKYIHFASGRRGHPGRLDVKKSLDMFRIHAFGAIQNAASSLAAQKGVFELYDGNTIIADDIHSANQEVKDALLDVLQEERYFKEGIHEAVPVKFFLISTSVITPEELDPKDTGFRRRVAILPIRVPYLSERRLDIPLLLRHFLEKNEVSNIVVRNDALLSMLNCHWTSDASQIEAFVETLVSQGIEEVTVNTVANYPDARLLTRPMFEIMNISKHFSVHTKIDRELEVFLMDDVYRPNDKPEDDWVQFPVRAFEIIKNEGRNTELSAHNGLYCSIGCGVGMDALAAELILKPGKIMLTDLSSDVVSLARENLLANSTRLKLADIIRVKSDLFNSVESLQADLIYENLPILPPSPGERVRVGRLTGSIFASAVDTQVPAEYEEWALASHYLFLAHAAKYLTPNGSVVCSIGGRVPWNVVAKMFGDNGFAPRLLVYDLKEQEERELVVGTLADVERLHGTKFRFLKLKQARRVLKKSRKQVEKSDKITGFASLREEVDRDLGEAVMTATEALKYKDPIGHMVYLVEGRPISSE